MKPGTNKKQLKENGKPEINQPPANRLSEDAFYLIALIHLLKKESGKNSLEQLLVPARIHSYKRGSER